jgi:hypothetical protein
MKPLQFLKTTLVIGFPFGILWGSYMRLEMGPGFGVGVAAVASLLFGVSMAGFQAWVGSSKQRREQMNLELFPGEVIERQGPANHKLGAEYRGGWLFLTDNRLVFRPHVVNFQKEPVDLDRKAVIEVRPVATLGLVPNGLLVVSKDGREDRFVVSRRKAWVEAIRSRGKA